MRTSFFICFFCFWFYVVIQKCPLVLSHVLPGCVWDWSHPTLWLLQTEILRADWCLVARRLGHLGRGRRCCREIWSWVTGMVGRVQESRLALDTPFIQRPVTTSQYQRQCFLFPPENQNVFYKSNAKFIYITVLHIIMKSKPKHA